MAGTSVRTIFLTLAVAVMVGVREATGIAPPPPTLGTGEIVWLSPGLDDDLDPMIVFVDAEPADTHVESSPDVRTGRGLLGSTWAFLRSVVRAGHGSA